MPKFLIEREVPAASELSPSELHSISKRSVGVLRQLGPEIQWIESYVAGDNLYCVYVAPGCGNGARAWPPRRFPVQRIFPRSNR